MGKRFIIGIAFLVLGIWFVRVENAFSGGYAIPPQSAKAASLANAVTAGVDDPSAIYSNPAALTEIEGNQIMGGLTYVNNLSSVTNSGRSSTNSHENNFIPTFFGNYQIQAANLTAGIGMYTPFGLSTSYEGDSFTRFASVQSKLRTLYITPGLAWRPFPYLSLGGGVSFVHSSAVLSQALFLGGPEGRLRITGADDAYAYNLGILVKPINSIKVGLTYRSRVDLNFNNADAKFADAAITGGALTLARAKGVHVPLPPVISTGINWKITPRWAVEFVYDYTRWSEFKSLSAEFSPALPALGGFVPIPGFVTPENWKNTSTLRFGTSYKINPNIELRAGLGLDETPIPSNTLSPGIPGADWMTLTGGIGYNWRNFGVDLGYMAVFYKTRTVTNDVMEGGNPLNPVAPGPDKYRTFQNLVLLTLRYRF